MEMGLALQTAASLAGEMVMSLMNVSESIVSTWNQEEEEERRLAYSEDRDWVLNVLMGVNETGTDESSAEVPSTVTSFLELLANRSAEPVAVLQQNVSDFTIDTLKEFEVSDIHTATTMSSAGSSLSTVMADYFSATSSFLDEGQDNATLETWLDNVELQSPSLAVILAMFSFITVFGNVLVMVAVARERYLHTITNYFIVSLATADCIVGALVMPFSVVYEMLNKGWPFGQDMCDLWHSVDVLASTASILNLCVISLDRFWAITDPMTYPSKMTTKRACILIALLWVCASLISFPAIAWWRRVSPGPPEPYTCIFPEDVGYTVFSSIISFYGPLSVMLFTYYRIYRAAAEQTRSLRLGTKQVLACNGEESMELTLRMHRGGGGSSGSRGGSTYHSMFGEPSEGYPLHPLGGREGCSRGGGASSSTSIRIVPKNLKHFSFSRKLAKIAKEQKAAKTLGIVVGVFVLCWLPFFVTTIILNVCPQNCIYKPDLVYSVVTWLGWINSGMNPVIYACWSRDFRRAFTKILCGCCPSVMRPQYRHRLRVKVSHVTSTPISSTCSTDCVKL